MSVIVVRGFEAGDKSFLYDAWLKSFKNTSDFAKRIPDGIFFHEHGEKITAMAMRSTARVVVATLDDEPGLILGFAAYEVDPGCLHYVYVREAWRKVGIARKMLGAAHLSGRVLFSHWTDPCASFVNRKDIELRYDPYRF